MSAINLLNGLQQTILIKHYSKQQQKFKLLNHIVKISMAYFILIAGTLNPALQDRFGRPKRDISTIIHILNDLLCATPQYRAAARSGTPAVCTATTLPPTASAAQAAAPFTTANSVSAQTSTASDNTGKT